MKNLNLLQKFAIMGGVFTLILVVQTVQMFIGTSSLDSNSERVANKEMPVLDKAHEVKLAVVQVQQWLTDISATRGQDGLNDGFDEAENNAKRFRVLIKELQQIDPENASSYAAMLPAFESYYEVGRKMAETYVAEGPAGGNKMMGQFDEVAEKLGGQVDAFLKRAQIRAKALLDEQRTSLSSMSFSLVIGTVLLFVVVGITGLFMVRAIQRLPELLQEVKRITAGDLSGRDIPATNNDEIAELCRGANEMKNKLKDIIAQVSHSSTQLVGQVEQMSAITEQSQSAIATQQSDVGQVATAMNEMSATAHEIARNAAAAAASAKEADGQSTEGRHVVAQTMDAIDALAQEVVRAADVIHKLEKDSESIGGILDVIRGIADQTNLLALNAAIEAARAGEQGRGFAVVADEVRTLAQRTQQSTREIQEMIQCLQEGSQNAVQVMEKGRSQAEASVAQAAKAGDRLEGITRSVSDITEMNTQIATASEEQSTVVEEINRNVTNISGVADQTAEAAEQTAQASHQLGELAMRLQGLVAQFKL